MDNFFETFSLEQNSLMRGGWVEGHGSLGRTPHLPAKDLRFQFIAFPGRGGGGRESDDDQRDLSLRPREQLLMRGENTDFKQMVCSNFTLMCFLQYFNIFK